MKRIALFGIAAAMLAAAPAFAADLAPVAAPMYKAPAMIVPPASWTGFYIGGDIGGSWSHTDSSWTGLPSAAAFGVNPTGGSLDGSGFLGGVHAGYDYQFAPAWVFGVEGDWTWTHDRGTSSQAWTLFGTGTPVPGGGATTMNATVDWLASFRGRIGYLVTPNVLAYATGGLAWGDVHYSGTASGGIGYLASTSFNNTSDGFVVGGGVEWAMTHNWSLRAEYLYYRLGSGASAVVTPAAFPGFPSSFSWGRTSVDVARVGLSYKF